MFFCAILTLVYSLRACHMWLTRIHMFIREIWGKFTALIFWNFQISLVSIGRFQNLKKVKSVNLSQISLLNMWLLVQTKQETLRVVTMARICSTLASLWKFQYFKRGIYDPVKNLWWCIYWENSKPLSIFTRKLHRKCSSEGSKFGSAFDTSNV